MSSVETTTKYVLASPEWFDMQERVVVDAVAQTDWPEGFQFSLVERFSGMDPLQDGSMQGFRLDIDPSGSTFRRGVAADETGDGTVEMTFAALDELKNRGQAVRVAFVHDRSSGNKLFADKVWYVQSGGKLSAFLLKAAAETYAKKNAGSVLAYDAARGTVLNR